ncbi:hypothetical protein ZWY2020_024868 [Hordeum vulgare]|nr:hypothetical protein ZWY2020_024868 [Hordeum vulgare]
MAPEPPVQQPLEPSVQAHEDEDKAYNRGVPGDDEEFQQTEAAAALPRCLQAGILSCPHILLLPESMQGNTDPVT